MPREAGRGQNAREVSSDEAFPPSEAGGGSPDGAAATELAFLRAVIEHTADVLAVLAPDGTTLYQSPATERALGWRPEQIVGRVAFDFVHPDDVPAVTSAFGRCLANPATPVSVTFRYRSAAGDWVLLEAVGTNHLDDPKVRGVVVNSRDVSQLRRTEEELARLAHVTRSIGDFVVLTDVEGRIQWVNQAVMDRMGWTAEELVGQPARVLLSPVNRPGLVEELRQARMSEGFRGDLVNRTKGGEDFWVSLTTSVIRRGEEVLGLVAVSREITDRKRAEEDLRSAKEEAERASRAKSEFLANMSHEIRTPMNAVIGMTGLLLETPLSEQQRDFVETIRTSGDALLTILNDILDFSKMESGRLELESQPFDLREAVDESVDLLAAHAAQKGLGLWAVDDGSVPRSVVGDVTRFRQVLVNLLSNAVKFTASGHVAVQVSARPAPGDGWGVSVAVADTGIGIPPQRRDRLFSPFTQVDASTTRQYGGTGLGLAICKRLCELMGGEIRVESEMGKGTTFSFSVRAGADPTSPAPEPPLRLRRLLLADADPARREAFARQAAAWGMAVTEASSASEAALLCAAAPFDSVLADQALPGLEELLSAVSAARPAPALLVAAPFGLRAPGLSLPPDALVLARPIRGRALLRALGGTGDDSSTRLRRRGAEAVSEGRPGDAHPLRILLAEDNPVNQKVALHLLSHLGYRADVAGNGLEVLEAVRRQPYDVVLMDVQMPEMDGLEAARWLRKEWPEEKRPRLVAMTANAMKGDREACLAAGMDDYVSKPVQAGELAAALGKTRKVGREAAPTASVGPIDRTALEKLRSLASPGEADVVTPLIDLFVRDAPQKIAAMEKAVAEGNLAGVTRSAHALKSSAASLGALRLAALCALVETATGLDAAAAQLGRVSREFGRAAEALALERRV
ncbi:MAG: PAS domain S-box protein [Acidobacteria bacterium]|nr:MAG: PAS domain S-box protein [Acidobacteriota bacterium]MCE7957343.1 PAS domain S-box protein [Acidobacteria bacterium ACB2]